jgi:tetratricopeptide (TPR) repeat protein
MGLEHEKVMAPPTFSELLTQYMSRTGINDSELARAIGVQRQTIFRWKEGLVARPRGREDVLRVAQKLRLTAEESDQLLLAAGFPPERRSVETFALETAVAHSFDEAPPLNPPQPGGDARGGAAGATHEADATLVVAAEHDVEATRNRAQGRAQRPPASGRESMATPPAKQRATQPVLAWTWAAALLVALALLFVGVGGLRDYLESLRAPTPIPTAQPHTPAAGIARQFPQAAQGEMFLLVAQFTGYTQEQFNVAGRIREELESTLSSAPIMSATVAVWPEVIASQAEAESALAAANATLIIWGEYDSGRVRANLTLSDKLLTHHVDFPLTSADDLVTTINEDVPAEVRTLALLTVGNLYPLDEFYTRAARTFQQALDLAPTQEKTRALLNFYLGLAVSKGGKIVDLERAIGYYTQALRLNPMLYDALYNRGTLWLHRSYLLEAGSAEIATSLDAAIADLTETLRVRPRYANAFLNRGIAYYERNRAQGAPGDQRLAVLDFNQVVALNPRTERGYYHRALAHIRAGTPPLNPPQPGGDARGPRGLPGEDWEADLRQTLAITPTYASAYNAFCWGYALAQQPEKALPHCDQAVALDPSGASQDGRGIALAQLGRYEEAAASLQAYLESIRSLQPPTAFERLRGPQVEGWIAALGRGENPFDEAMLAALR